MAGEPAAGRRASSGTREDGEDASARPVLARAHDGALPEPATNHGRRGASPRVGPSVAGVPPPVSARNTEASKVRVPTARETASPLLPLASRLPREGVARVMGARVAADQ